MSAPVYDAAVIGAGPAGLSAALALASVGCRTVLAGPPHDPDPARPDTRTTALLRASVRLLRNLGVWEQCGPEAEPLRVIRIIDDTGRLLRAPEVCFDSAEIGGEPFGYNIPNTALVAALRQRAGRMSGLDLIETAAATSVDPGPDRVHIGFAEGNAVSARLVAGADGRDSLCRQASGLRTTSWSYPQKAIACNFAHAEPHGGASNEFHRAAGPFTTVPLPGNASSLVWVETPREADRLMTLGGDGIAREIEDRLYSCLGEVSDVGPLAAFPLKGLGVHGRAARRIALIGEAAHVIPPIGAQGLNLGFRDAAALADCAAEALRAGEDPGAEASLRAYDGARRADVASRTFAVDLLNRSLITGFVPLRAARGLGLHLLAGVAPLRRLFMREGMAPRAGLPRLMREAGTPLQG